jgi:hypothetical protein
MELELLLTWAVITTIFLIIIVGVLIKLRKKHERNIQELEFKLNKKQKASFQMGVNTTSGDYTQILGDFALLSEYDQIITLSTTSKQPSLDLIGVNNESIDFLEIKKKGAKITKNENHIKKLVENKKVAYKVFDIDLPNEFTIKERLPEEHTPKKKENKNNNSQKVEAQKINTSAYESWTISDEEFLKKYWNDKSNKLNEYEKIKELQQKTGRSKGAIVSRLEKIGLD